MPAIPVPDLKRKFDLLRRYPTPRTWPALAEPFGRKFKTLQSWQDGTLTSDPDLMPDWAVPILIRLIGDILPGTRSPETIRQLALGPAALLEGEVRTGAAVSLLELITREARRDTATLFREGTAVELVEVDTEDRSPCPRLRLGERFRIAFRRRVASGYAVALQHAQHSWALLPATPSRAAPATLLVPGVDDRGEPRFMSERRDPGRHLFVCLETPAPPPAVVTALGRDEVAVDKRLLDALAEFYLGQKETTRACHALELEFEAAGGT